MSTKRSRKEQGTVAIVVAVGATMIFALCALGVDLGNGFARKRDIQTQADLAALAAAVHLPHSASTESAIFDAATDYATWNEVLGQDTTTWNFSDADKTNGYIEFVGVNKLRLLAPRSHVNFVLAPAAGLPNGMDVSAVAAAEIQTPGKGLPFFVSDSCGWGLETILDATSGPPVPPGYVPTLDPSSTPASSSKIHVISPSAAPLNAPTTSMTLTATTNNGFDGIDKVGFTTESGDHETVDVTGSGDTLLITVPPDVLTTEAIWWVRVHKASTDRWSASDNAKTFVVGDPDAVVDGSCDSKNSGNFGSLALSRDDVGQPSQYLVENMALGIQHGLDAYPIPRPVPPDGCEGRPEAVTDTGTPIDSQLLNCLVTDTGSDLAQAATDAFIKGTAQGSPARLGGVDTAPGCDPDEGSNERTVHTSGNPNTFKINDDVLSCFIEAPYTVGDVTKASGAPANVISEDIFDSPRFFWIPVLVADPAGGANSYAIVDMRPVFITAQDDAATKDSPLPALNPENGIEMSANGIEKIRIRAINWKSLPEFTGDPAEGSIPYIGFGTKVVRLVE